MTRSTAYVPEACEGDGHRPGADAGTPVRDADGGEPNAQLLRADDTWIVVDSDGDSRPPVLGIRG
ncbi:hypothetical protein ACFV5G_25050 [Streptomyces sp. NPDC059766]|uniref:hypothetical protein n=1 Tax=Streptomyces sp. NPDC059766 TaxID=3346940 RepID=UPI00364B6EE2